MIVSSGFEKPVLKTFRPFPTHTNRKLRNEFGTDLNVFRTGLWILRVPNHGVLF